MEDSISIQRFDTIIYYFSGMLRTTRQYLQYMGYLGRLLDVCTSEVKAPMMENMKLFSTFRLTILKALSFMLLLSADFFQN